MRWLVVLALLACRSSDAPKARTADAPPPPDAAPVAGAWADWTKAAAASVPHDIDFFSVRIPSGPLPREAIVESATEIAKNATALRHLVDGAARGRCRRPATDDDDLPDILVTSRVHDLQAVLGLRAAVAAAEDDAEAAASDLAAALAVTRVMLDCDAGTAAFEGAVNDQHTMLELIAQLVARGELTDVARATLRDALAHDGPTTAAIPDDVEPRIREALTTLITAADQQRAALRGALD